MNRAQRACARGIVDGTTRTVDQAVDEGGRVCADLLYHLILAETPAQVQAIHHRAELLVKLFDDVSRAALRTSDALA